jgi:hypothetical protein
MDRSRDQFFLGWCPPPPLQPGMVGSFPGMGCVVSPPFAAEGNQSYPEFWAIIGTPRYPGYITPNK